MVEPFVGFGVVRVFGVGGDVEVSQKPEVPS
jgi:hypothetical protein